ncbi:hypothetical protein J6590_099768 [Homalodisca vitripennis]|nr:hypothetical protein J6590_099768 [Homalodisca vitripennis]
MESPPRETLYLTVYTVFITYVIEGTPHNILYNEIVKDQLKITVSEKYLAPTTARTNRSSLIYKSIILLHTHVDMTFTPAYYNHDMKGRRGVHGSFASSGLFDFLRSDVKVRRQVYIHGVLNWYSKHLKQIIEGRHKYSRQGNLLDLREFLVDRRRGTIHIHGVLNWYTKHVEQIIEGGQKYSRQGNLLDLREFLVDRLRGTNLYATQGLRREYSEVTDVPLPHRRESVDSNEIYGNSGRPGIT